MDQRLTKEVVLPKSASKVVLYSYLVNGDYKQIEEHLAALIQPDFSGIDKSLPEEEQKQLRDIELDKASSKMRAVAFIKSKNLVTKLLIKEAFTKTGEKITDLDGFIYNLVKADADFLDKEVEEIDRLSALDEDQKKNSPKEQ